MNALIEIKNTANNLIASQEFGANLLNDFFEFLDVSEKHAQHINALYVSSSNFLQRIVFKILLVMIH